MEPSAICLQCGVPLRGRTDKRFCDDQCRNSYNREKRRLEKGTDHPNIPAIINIIKENYALLKRIGPKENGPDYVLWKGNITSIGIDTNFYTSTLQEAGDLWYCCFDYCWQGNEDTWMICRKPQKAEIKEK